MVAYHELLQRAAVYAAATLGLCLLSHNAIACSLLLTGCACALAWHAQKDNAFMLVAAIFFTFVEVCVFLGSDRAVVYDAAAPVVGVPLWVAPWWAVRARWMMDLYCFTSLVTKPIEDKDPSASV
jgi:hypothetical protein